MLSKLSKIKIGGTLVSVVIASVAWLITRDTISSFLVGLVAETLAFLIDLDQELASVRAGISRTLEMRERLAKHQEILKEVQTLGEDFADVLDSGNPHFVAQAKELMTGTLHQMSCLRQGFMEVTPSPPTRGVIILNNLQIGGFATSIVGQGGFWKSEAGQVYHRANLKAVRQGRKITRIFLFQSNEILADSDFKRILDEQIQAGIEVRAAWLKNLNPELRVDFAIWDDKLLVDLRIVPGTTEVALELLDTRDGALARARQLRDQLRNKSVPINSIADLDRLQESLHTSRPKDGA